ncbi:MAG: hypothetical protein OHK0023_22600 [Anaerolineae bacterium]
MQQSQARSGGFTLAALCMLLTLLAPIAIVHAQGTLTAATITVSGTILLGTGGEQLPSDMPLTLRILRSAGPDQSPVIAEQRETQAAADGSYRFEGVLVYAQDVLFVSAEYGGIAQSTVLVAMPDPPRDLDFPPLTLYQSSTDVSSVRLIRAQFTYNARDPNTLEVLASYAFQNRSDRYFSTGVATSDGRQVSLQLPLPIGAYGVSLNLALENDVLIGGTQVAPVIQDTRAVFPNSSHEIVLSYLLPYNRSATLDQDFPYGADVVEVFVPEDLPLRFEAEAGLFVATRNTTLSAQRPYQQYTLQKPLKTGETLIFTLSGALAPEPTPHPPKAVNPTQAEGGVAYVVLGVIILGMFLAAFVVFRRILGREKASP